MNRSSSSGEAEEQNTWRALVVRIALNFLGHSPRLADFIRTNVPLHDSLEGVTRQFELAGGKLMPNLIKGFQNRGSSSKPPRLGIIPPCGKS